MSGRLRARLGSLEQRVRDGGQCKACFGRTLFKMPTQEDEPVPEHCRRCGREYRVVQFIEAVPPAWWKDHRDGE